MELTMSMFATPADYWKARAELAEATVRELVQELGCAADNEAMLAACADVRRFRTLLRMTGNEWTIATPGVPHAIEIRLDCTGCEKYLPDGAVNFPATIRAALDDEQRIQDSWRKTA